MRVARRVLQMDDAELSAVIAVAMPGRKIKGLRRDERQEICMKWLFANGLSMNHQFTLEKEDDEIFVLMSNKQECPCCKKDENSVSVRSFDNGIIGSSLVTFRNDKEGGNVQLPAGKVARRRSSSTEPRMAPPAQPAVHRARSSDDILGPSLSDRRGQKIQPICTNQPLPMKGNPERKPPKKEPPEDEGCCRTFWRELGTCCLGLCSNC